MSRAVATEQAFCFNDIAIKIFAESMDHSGRATCSGNSKTSILGIVGGATLLSLVAPLSVMAKSFTPVFTLDSSNAITPPQSISIYGYNFVTEIDRTIKSVGIYSKTDTPHTIGIWDFSTNAPTLLLQKQIPNVDKCNLYQSFCWFDVPNQSLQANKSYVIAATWGSGELIPAQINPSNVFVNVNNFKLNDTATTDVGDPDPSTYLVDLTNFAPTGIASSDDKGYYTANLSFDEAPTSQTPAPLPLLGATAAFGLSRKIRRRITASS
jgi:hypothetical protein